MYFLLNISYMFRRALRHPQEELITSQNHLLIVRVLQQMS